MVPESYPAATPVPITEQQARDFQGCETHLGMSPDDPHGDPIEIYHVPDQEYRAALGRNVERAGMAANRANRRRKQQARRRR